MIARLLRKLPKRRDCNAHAKASKSQCTKKALWGTRYCWHHESKLYLLISALIGIASFLWTAFLKDRIAPSPKLLELRSRVVELSNTVNMVRQDAEKTLLIVSGNEEGEFAKEFPLGYSVFAVTGQKTFVPYESSLRGDYVIRWETARISNLTRSNFMVRFPDLQATPSGNMIKGAELEISRIVGPRVPAIGVDYVGLYAKVLANTESGVVVLIGLRQIDRP